jgi:DNA-binding response OmpR family regulator
MANENKNNSKKILVIEEVEDDTSLRSVLRTKFIKEGFNVLEAGDGEEGLAIALHEHPNLIVLDILMPKMDGITMMEKLRHVNEWGKKVPIILLTNVSADDERINKAVTENEPAYYLVKANYTISDLVEKIKERLVRQ